jgi:hypothetical protein
MRRRRAAGSCRRSRPVADAAAAREQAREILSQGRYHDTDLPRPLAGPLHWLQERLNDIGDWFSGLFDDVDAGVPGGRWVVWVLLAAIVGAIAVAVARSAVRRRSIAAYARGDGSGGAEALDPRELERLAAEAEGAGEYERAVRLRFRAGVLRLALDDALTTGAIAAELHSRDFDALGTDFDAIAYGGREADASDASAAREGWAAVLEEARR